MSVVVVLDLQTFTKTVLVSVRCTCKTHKRVHLLYKVVRLCIASKTANRPCLMAILSKRLFVVVYCGDSELLVHGQKNF